MDPPPSLAVVFADTSNLIAVAWLSVDSVAKTCCFNDQSSGKHTGSPLPTHVAPPASPADEPPPLPPLEPPLEEEDEEEAAFAATAAANDEAGDFDFEDEEKEDEEEDEGDIPLIADNVNGGEACEGMAPVSPPDIRSCCCCCCCCCCSCWRLCC